MTQCENLKTIDISGCRLTDVGIKSLCAVSKLTNLNVSGTNVTSEQLQELVKGLPDLIKLGVADCRNVATEVLDEIADKKSKDNQTIEISYNPFFYVGFRLYPEEFK